LSDAVPAAFVNTNILVRHLTGDPPAMAQRATRYLRDATALLLVDVVVAELVYVLESYYRRPRSAVAEVLRAVIGFRAIHVVDPDLLHRAIEVYEHDRLDFPEAYLVASAERSGVSAVVSFDRSIDRATTIRRVEPA
jgi:predicted nucleic-acid-binding protein